MAYLWSVAGPRYTLCAFRMICVIPCHRAFYDADELDTARRWLQKALHIAPGQPLLRFNIAAVMQACALALASESCKPPAVLSRCRRSATRVLHHMCTLGLVIGFS